MDIKQMQYFLCLAQEGNVTRAARQLNIVQPALSMQIAKLEKSLGKQLFYRGSHGMSLTAAGEALALRLAPIVADIDRARDEMAQLDGKVSGRVSLGMITSAAQNKARSRDQLRRLPPDIPRYTCWYAKAIPDGVGDRRPARYRHRQCAGKAAGADGQTHPR
jgi:LysR family transcriptional regulator, nitrogen assimilation regulatory protein